MKKFSLHHTSQRLLYQTTNNYDYVNYIQNTLSNKYWSTTLILDLRKASERIWLQILIGRLMQTRLRGKITKMGLLCAGFLAGPFLSEITHSRILTSEKCIVGLNSDDCVQASDETRRPGLLGSGALVARNDSCLDFQSYSKNHEFSKLIKDTETRQKKNPIIFSLQCLIWTRVMTKRVLTRCTQSTSNTSPNYMLCCLLCENMYQPYTMSLNFK